MIGHIRFGLSLVSSILLVSQLTLLVHCIVEDEPTPSPVEEEPSVPITSSSNVVRRGGSGNSDPFPHGFGYVPNLHRDTLGRPLGGLYCDLTPLKIDTEGFNKHCGPNSDSKWPCFAHNGNDRLETVSVEPWSKPLNMTDEIRLKDSTTNAFTLRDPSVEFTIAYAQTRNVRFRYYGYEPDTGCYKIHLSGREQGRIHVTTTDENYRDIDTWNYRETGKRLCNKWIFIGTRDRDRFSELRDSDGSGI